ncbi:acetyltransferase [Erwinia phage AH04]|uniref:Acetyltransferase n=1 Tax=Erwinia phage AH04 TaxID=2869569 RepID=A0AAE7X0R5_9CAUD|nr:acetyltransferase [Erwinia phage AH04]QZA70700.1 acetyltransferase [Erwinia phage AH04]
MKNKRTVTWIVTNDDVTKGIAGDWEGELLTLMNDLVEYEVQFRDLPFEKDMSMGKQNRLADFVTAGAYLVFITNIVTQEVIGTTLVRPVDSGEHRLALLGFLHIKKKYQRKGYGAHLMNEAEMIAKKMGCHAIRLSVLGKNKSAKEFYGTLLYSTTEIFMAKSL